MSNLEALIQAAQYLEENDHDEENTSRKRTSRNRQKKPSSYSRTTHNLLEKNRRAQLRDCLEVLRQHVPLPDKLTTLALLQSARKYIESLQQKEKDDDQLVVKLQNEQAFLLSRLVELGATGYVESISPEPTNNGTQNQTTSSILNTEIMVSHTLTPTNSSGDKEEDESVVVDVLTHESEDDTSSITSGSDGGCTSTTHKYEVAV